MTKTPTSSRSAAATSAKRDGGRTAISLENFAQKKGQVRALEEFHKRKNKKRFETSKALRKYRKVMKQEGLEAGTGASRKRGGVKATKPEEKGSEPAVENLDADHSEKETEENQNEEQQVAKPVVPHNKRSKKSNPFQKSIQQAKENKKRAEQVQVDQAKREKERNKKLRERKIRTKKLQQRTRKGQPIMKHAMQDLLRKLEKQK